MGMTQPIRSKNQIRELAEYYLKRGQLRNYTLIILGIHSALRISDLLRLRWDDVYDFNANRAMLSISVRERKTGKSKVIALNKAMVRAVNMFAKLNARKGRFVIENPKTRKAISRIQAYRLIRSAAEALCFVQRVSCHSLRKTFGYHAWKGGVSPAVIMEIYNHSSFAVTRRYLGVSQDDKDLAYLSLEFVPLMHT